MNLGQVAIEWIVMEHIRWCLVYILSLKYMAKLAMQREFASLSR